MKTPNPLMHLILSIGKSIFRILGGISAIVSIMYKEPIENSISILAFMLVLAEIIGILEEIT